jgi:hypothetical protein
MHISSERSIFFGLKGPMLRNIFAPFYFDYHYVPFLFKYFFCILGPFGFYANLNFVCSPGKLMQTEAPNINVALTMHKNFKTFFYLAIQFFYFLWNLLVAEVNGNTCKSINHFFF